jgi:hypothetical protein
VLHSTVCALMASPILALVTKAGPWLIKQLPKLWPLLLETKNREKLQEITKDLASNSPSRRLRAKVELTATLAERMVAEAESEDEKQRAQAWSRQARNLTIRLDMPVIGREAKRSHRQSIAQQLEELQADMNRYLAG